MTDAEKDAFALASAWIDQVLDWGRALARRAQDQAAACAAADKAPVR